MLIRCLVLLILLVASAQQSSGLWYRSAAAAEAAESDSGYGPLFNSITITLFGAVLTFAMTWFWFAKRAAMETASKLAEENQKMLARLAEAEAKLARIDQVVVPINTMMQAMLIKELTHDHTPRMDELMMKVGPPNTLTTEERVELLVLLMERTTDHTSDISQRERGAAVLLPEVMERATAEQALLSEADDLRAKLVSVVTVIGVPPSDQDTLPTK